MEELCRRGANPATVLGSGKYGRIPTTPLIQACSNWRVAAAEWLLDHGAPIDAAPDERRKTALMAACGCGAAECVKLLLLRNACTELRNADGRTALCVACTARVVYPAIIAHLLDHGADATVKCDNRSLFQLVAGIDSWRIPVPYGSDTERSISEESLAWLCKMDALIARLVAAGADVKGVLDDVGAGATPLLLAARAGRVGAVRMLCAFGAGTHPAAAGALAEVTAAINLSLKPNCHSSNAWQIPPSVAALAFQMILDELLERGADPATKVGPSASMTAFAAAVEIVIKWLDRSTDDDRDHREDLLRRLALQLARWPPGAPLPPQEAYAGFADIMIPASLEHARRRLEVLRQADAQELQQGLTEAFLRHLRDSCGGALALPYAPFARFRCAAAGGLERAWALEREMHRFPVERVVLRRLALQLASEADAAAAVHCVPLLRGVVASVSSSGGDRAAPPGREAEKRLYAAVRAVARWGEIRGAIARAGKEVGAAEVALHAAVEEAEAALDRLDTHAERCLRSVVV